MQEFSNQQVAKFLCSLRFAQTNSSNGKPMSSLSLFGSITLSLSLYGSSNLSFSLYGHGSQDPYELLHMSVTIDWDNFQLPIFVWTNCPHRTQVDECPFVFTSPSMIIDFIGFLAWKNSVFTPFVIITNLLTPLRILHRRAIHASWLLTTFAINALQTIITLVWTMLTSP